MRLKGSQILMEALKREGVKVIFGYPGGAVLPIFDALYDYSGVFEVYQPRHEQAAAHAADGYARATGRTGVCLATSGPGATNLVTGIATANMDSVPMVAITGQVGTRFIGSDAFQEVDTIGISDPITKHNFLVKDANELARTVHEAFYIARTGRPGPVLIDIPVDVQRAEAELNGCPKMSLRGYHPYVKISPDDVKLAMAAVRTAKRPLFYVGGGIISSNSSREFTLLARTLGIPVVTTLNGLGAFPATDPLSLGMLGMHGTVVANLAVQSCDLLIAMGVRFDDRVTGKTDEFAPNAKVVHVDIDPSSINKNVMVDIPLVGNVSGVIRLMRKTAKKLKIGSWLAKVQRWKTGRPLGYASNGEVKPQSILQSIFKLIGGQPIIVTDVGQHQMWTAQWYPFTRPRSLLSSGGLGTMGFGLPAAIGAHIGQPHRPVILITGDGSIQMNIQELMTCRALNAPIKIFVFNNHCLGMVHQWQKLFWNKRYSGTDLEAYDPDFVAVANAYGIPGETVSLPGEAKPAIVRALGHPGPYLVNFLIDKEENVLPMVPSGRPNHEMIERLV